MFLGGSDTQKFISVDIFCVAIDGKTQHDNGTSILD